MTLNNIINQYSFVTTWSDEDDIYITYTLELPSVKAHGSSESIAINNLKKALLVSLEWMLEDKLFIPYPISNIAS